ncbi:winged helix-turn-helix domain-containing protein [Streptomyces sp. NPDC051776]|uniref:winged helix-turn-helix domain-containing protein n=1 Tax=Streptomyces sp. NPDC051776 TaxID=3155414 RepID=UPI00342E8ABC
MTNSRSLSASSVARTTAPVSSSPVPSGAASATPGRHRLRAVDRDEVVDLPDFLPPGATWFPAPQHTVPALPGRPPMVGYLVLVPADEPSAQLALAPGGTASSAEVDSADKAFVNSAFVNGAFVNGAFVNNPSGPGASGLGRGPGTDAAGGPVRIDEERRTVHLDGRPLDLTYLEFELLAHLVAHPHRVHSRDHLVTTVWGYGHIGDGRTVDVHVARLRRKLGAAHREAIVTVRRVGYKYVPSAV